MSKIHFVCKIRNDTAWIEYWYSAALSSLMANQLKISAFKINFNYISFIKLPKWSKSSSKLLSDFWHHRSIFVWRFESIVGNIVPCFCANSAKMEIAKPFHFHLAVPSINIRQALNVTYCFVNAKACYAQFYNQFNST